MLGQWKLPPLRGARIQVALLSVLVLLCVDWLAVDRWGLKGVVRDERGVPISDAFVFAQFDGKTPLINIPYGPDPSYRTSECMGVRVEKTDPFGRFRFDVFTSNRRLAEKSAQIIVFKPGWLTTSASSRIASSLLGVSPDIRLGLNHGPGERRSNRLYEPGAPQLQLAPEERTYSQEVFDATGVVVEATAQCGAQGIPMALAAMQRALEIAATYGERKHVKSACGFAKARAGAQQWPFDCEHLRYNRPVSPEVLAVEAESAADQRRRLERGSKN